MDNRKVIIHAKNHKYVDKKMIDGKWRYYYKYDKAMEGRPTQWDRYQDSYNKWKHSEKVVQAVVDESNAYGEGSGKKTIEYDYDYEDDWGRMKVNADGTYEPRLTETPKKILKWSPETLSKVNTNHSVSKQKHLDQQVSTAVRNMNKARLKTSDSARNIMNPPSYKFEKERLRDLSKPIALGEMKLKKMMSR